MDAAGIQGVKSTAGGGGGGEGGGWEIFLNIKVVHAKKRFREHKCASA